MIGSEVAGADRIREPDWHAHRSPPTARAIAVLHLLATEPQRGFSLTEVANRLGLNKGTCQNILLTLVETGTVLRSSGKAYSLGPSMVALGAAAGASRPTIGLASEALARISRELDAECTASVLEDDYVTIVAWSSPPGRAATSLLGQRVPAIPPFGNAHIAWRPRVEIERWLAKAEPVAVARLEQALAAIRGRGFAIERYDDTYQRIRQLVQELRGQPMPAWAQSLLDTLIGQLPSRDFLGDELVASHRYYVNRIAVPVFNRGGVPELTLAALVEREVTYEAIQTWAGQLRAEADRITTLINEGWAQP